MFELKFNQDLCYHCNTQACLTKCKFMDIDNATAKNEILKIVRGEDSFVLHECVTCYACEEYCPYGNHPFYLIVERQEALGITPQPLPLVKRAINIGIPFRGEPEINEINGPVINLGAFSQLKNKIQGKLFDGLSIISSDERKMFHYFCQLMYLHYGKISLIKERLPNVISTITKHKPAEVICFHDECYGAYTLFCNAYGISVPFRPVHLFEYLFSRLIKLRDLIKPINIKVAYQRPCSSRLCPDKHLYVNRIFELIGAVLVKRQFSDENALCCGLTIQGQKKEGSRKRALEIQRKNIEDIEMAGAEVCVFNCPACFDTLSIKLKERNIIPTFMSDLCRISIGEISFNDIKMSG
ncbi:MAG TPA: (Fe-S)-binding protein [Syntrophorhabdaceae bacterium]|nr:(Fe-S)-binding protein [Syntrophorhabdaceae bacterium]